MVNMVTHLNLPYLNNAVRQIFESSVEKVKTNECEVFYISYGMI